MFSLKFLSQYISGQYQFCYQCLFFVYCTAKLCQNKIFLNFTMTVFVKILGAQEAWSLGVIWLNTVVFLWILVNKDSVNISSNGNAQLIFICC